VHEAEEKCVEKKRSQYEQKEKSANAENNETTYLSSPLLRVCYQALARN